jgi:trk system potassium uptake protein TrkH
MKRELAHSTHAVLRSFLGLILIGTVLLKLPVSTASGRFTSWVDALFTATSATCVTGLIVQDTGSHFSLFGQIVILALIQLGGLGIMTFSALFLVSLGRLSMRAQVEMRDILDTEYLNDVGKLVAYVAVSTFLIELVGAASLFAAWRGEMGGTAAEAWAALFHAVSAFCNAGFSLFSDSLMAYRADVVVVGTVGVLVVAGGLGFVVGIGLLRTIQDVLRGHRRRRLSLHSKAVLRTTGILLAAGMILVLVLEWSNTLAGAPIGEKLLGALFASITPRTAGFNTIDYARIAPATLFFTMLLMFIGGSPGGTAGGIKTSTLAVLVAAIRSMLRGSEEVVLFGRTLPRIIIRKSLAVTLMFASLLSVFVFLLLLMERGKPFHALLFEAVSAFGTVGLSTGVTPELTTPGKLLVTIFMYAGRVGPLTLAMSMSLRAKEIGLRYPEERVMVG